MPGLPTQEQINNYRLSIMLELEQVVRPQVYGDYPQIEFNVQIRTNKRGTYNGFTILIRNGEISGSLVQDLEYTFAGMNLELNHEVNHSSLYNRITFGHVDKSDTFYRRGQRSVEKDRKSKSLDETLGGQVDWIQRKFNKFLNDKKKDNTDD